MVVQTTFFLENTYFVQQWLNHKNMDNICVIKKKKIDEKKECIPMKKKHIYICKIDVYINIFTVVKKQSFSETCVSKKSRKKEYSNETSESM